MPEFDPGEPRTAIAPMSNPTARGFDYTAELYLGLLKVASSGVIPFSLAAGETRNISFPLTMPSAQGIYPVYLDVFSNGQLIGAYTATEDVVIVPEEPEAICEFSQLYPSNFSQREYYQFIQTRVTFNWDIITERQIAMLGFTFLVSGKAAVGTNTGMNPPAKGNLRASGGDPVYVGLHEEGDYPFELECRVVCYEEGGSVGLCCTHKVTGIVHWSPIFE